MLRGNNELHLNKATVQAILTEWLKASWPSEAGNLNITDVMMDPVTSKVVFTMEPLPAPAPAPAEPTPPPA